MDIEHFLKLRINFIKYFYETSVVPFENIKSLIDAGKEPYSPKYGYEESEPSFLLEWEEAVTGINTISQTCLSLLSSSFLLFMESYFVRLKQTHTKNIKLNPKKGKFNGYKMALENLGYSFKKCGVDLGIIEQITLARNRVQHPGEISDLRVSHAKSDLEKYPNPYFINEYESKMSLDENGDISWWYPPSVEPNKEKIFFAILTVEKFVSWLEKEYWKDYNA